MAHPGDVEKFHSVWDKVEARETGCNNICPSERESSSRLASEIGDVRRAFEQSLKDVHGLCTRDASPKTGPAPLGALLLAAVAALVLGVLALAMFTAGNKWWPVFGSAAGVALAAGVVLKVKRG